MINVTIDQVVFNRTGKVLHEDVCSALRAASSAILDALQLDRAELGSVTTKTNLRAAFPKFVEGRVLADERRCFGVEYVEAAYAMYEGGYAAVTEDHFRALMFPDDSGEFSYKRAYAQTIRTGAGVFLVALHCLGAITLPVSFSWPSLREDRGGRRIEIGKFVCSELLDLIRSLDSQESELKIPAFDVLGSAKKRREWFLSYATKVILATGWQTPEDVNLEDLMAIKAKEKTLGVYVQHVYRTLLDVLVRAFGDRVSVTPEIWGRALESRVHCLPDLDIKNDGIDLIDIVEELLDSQVAMFTPEKMIKNIKGIPGLDVDVRRVGKVWIDIENLYLKKISRENYKSIKSILSWWNCYLFYYLPVWFDRHGGTTLAFPGTPALLARSRAFFVSRLLDVDHDVPMTFLEFMDIIRRHRGWVNNSYYALLKNLEAFFAFIEDYAEELEDCSGFTQPLASHDFPRTTKYKVTTKRPIPKCFFKVYIIYHETILHFLNAVLQGVLCGEISSEAVQKMTRDDVIDTFAWSSTLGFVPVLAGGKSVIPLRFIPNVIDADWREIKGKGRLYVPHPHGLTQNLAALHAGARGNHLQWLDRRSFDRHASDDGGGITLLYLNTDKVQSSGQTVHVHRRVIELLRSQREWVELIDAPEFQTEHYYNNEPKTKWPKILPLFAYKADGAPHLDEIYAKSWKRMLLGLEGLLPQLTEYGKVRGLLRLLPKNVHITDPNIEEKLKQYGASQKVVCELRVSTEITPHSARATVISEARTFLTPDLIGTYLTGQTEPTVIYYMRPDADSIRQAEAYQGQHIRDAVIRDIAEPAIRGKRASSALIQADHVNSNLSRSLRSNPNETIECYGCMSITFSKPERDGIDVWQETMGEGAAANKTEICPFGNNCPPEIIKELRGRRRCGLCRYAMRCIDHLPAIHAKQRQLSEQVDTLEASIELERSTVGGRRSEDEIELLEQEAADLCEELAGWILNGEVLEGERKRIAEGEDARRWIVQKPEIIEKKLQRCVAPNCQTAYLLARLGECLQYPTMENEEVRARFDLLRRRLLCERGNLQEALALNVPPDPASECAGILRWIVDSCGLSLAQVAELLDGAHLSRLPEPTFKILGYEANDGEIDD